MSRRRLYEELARIRLDVDDKFKGKGFFHIPFICESPTALYIFSILKNKLHSILNSISNEESIVLDIGCARGIDLLQVKHARHGVGIDISSTYLKDAQQSTKRLGLSNLSFVCADAENLPFRPTSFNLVILSEVVEHLENPGKGVKEINLVLKRNGILLLTTPNRVVERVVSRLESRIKTFGRSILPKSVRKNHLHFIEDWYFDEARRRGSKLYKKEHIYVFSPGEIRKLVKSHGFHIKKIKGGSILIPFQAFFDQHNVLFTLLKVIDNLLEIFPRSFYTKWSLIIEAKKQ